MASKLIKSIFCTKSGIDGSRDPWVNYNFDKVANYVRFKQMETDTKKE